MTELLELFKYVVPALLVMLSAHWLLKRFFKQQNEMKLQDRKQEISIEMLKIRLQAYERILLFLERIRLQNLILRHDHAQMDALAYRHELLENIRLEFEHNLVQQLYVSPGVWEKMMIAKNRITFIINEAGNKKTGQDSAGDLAIRILEMEMADGDNAVQSAVDFVKQEVSELF